MDLATLDELHVLGRDIYAQSENLPKQQKKTFLIDAVYDLLKMAYIFGSRRVDEDIPVEANKLYRALYEPVAGENFEQRIARRVDEETLDFETLQRIIDTDYHRLEETGAYDTAKGVEERTGQTAYKVWRTMEDDRVRDSHWPMEGQTVPIDARFASAAGNETLYPGQFGIAEEDCNCRCWCSYTFR